MKKHRDPNRPNVVFVLTDDQGYGDLGCTGNPWIATPHLDRFHGESTRFADYHVAPLCAPTRGALMTGRNPMRNGVWATCWGRSILRRSETTMADIFAANGYRTGMFGKWHLGDNYPYRPQDRGFQHVVAHKGGGVGQTPDFWGNNYFDDTYFHNGRPVAHEGYCTDVWFTEALKFIEAHQSEPFFCYVATNAPHDPYLVADRYRLPYEGVAGIPHPAFYGMISNIDENFGRLRAKLQELGIEDDTVLIFMTDNGTSGGCRHERGTQHVTQGYNAGMRGMKGSYYDGGHRVPFFLRWPAGGLTGGTDVGELVTHVDVLPTLIDLCRLTLPVCPDFDGISVAPLLRGRTATLPDRFVFVQYRQNTNPPDKWENAVLTKRWRLVRGAELYDIKADPSQRQDVAARHPEVVAELRAAHERWWERVAPGLNEYSPISLGNAAENPTRLDAMDVLGDVAWHQGHIAMAQKTTGRWAVNVEQPGHYTFVLRRWPDELDLPIEATLADAESDRLAPYCIDFRRGARFAPRAIHPVKARLKIFDREESLPVASGAREVVFDIALRQSGVTDLDAWFVNADGTECGAYYVTVKFEA